MDVLFWQARFGELNKKAMVAALNCLLNAHLADHQARARRSLRHTRKILSPPPHR